jgi:hypothetical protein
MDFDLVLRDVRLADAKPVQPAIDIGVKDRRIAAIAPQLGGSAQEQVQGGGRQVCSGSSRSAGQGDSDCGRLEEQAMILQRRARPAAAPCPRASCGSPW